MKTVHATHLYCDDINNTKELMPVQVDQPVFFLKEKGKEGGGLQFT